MAEFNVKDIKIDKALEFLGIAVGLTVTQMVVLYLLFAQNLAGRYNVFLIYRHFFEKFLFVMDRLYFLFVDDIMFKLFGPSYLHVPGFNNVFKLTFFTILLINLAFIVVTSKGKKDEND